MKPAPNNPPCPLGGICLWEQGCEVPCDHPLPGEHPWGRRVKRREAQAGVPDHPSVPQRRSV